MHNGRKRSLERALRSSLDCILSQQQHDGSWIDWDLPPGPSSIWTTAFVGCKLADLDPGLRGRASDPIDRASNWLGKEIFPDGGWGYNEKVDSDADSTALAILFLASTGQNVLEASYARLQGFQCSDGGFATFRGPHNLGSWGVSHGDVTPSAILAMMTKYNVVSEPVDRGIEFLLSQRTSTGIWQSFWWTSFLYSTEKSLCLLRAVGRKVDLQATRKTLLHTRPQHPFESALLLSSLLCIGDINEDGDIEPLMDQLLQNQEPDGSWQSSPMLRVTRRDCLEHWKPGDSDRLYCDPNRLFTTATVLDALSKSYLVLK